MFVLDTNVVSELRRATFGKADPGVTAEFTFINVASRRLHSITTNPRWATSS
ncbi:MAG: hypothetical protein ACRC67_04630 [Inquilinus sp.]|uniref:hypothetical protein n=1 Tax=Inquilinus sp. TaxID=1932117 RepID=UPI003F3B073D